MFETIINTFKLIGHSLSLAFRHKRLLIIPAITGLMAVLVFAGMIGLIMLYVWGYKEQARAMTESETQKIIFTLVWFFVYFFFTNLILTIGELILAHATGDFFRTGKVSLADATSKGFQRFGITLAWAATAAVIYSIAKLFKDEEKNRPTLGDAIMLGWRLATFFIVPVFAFEQQGVIASIKQSATIFKNHFGKTAVATFSFGQLICLLMLFSGLLLKAGSYVGIPSLMNAILVGSFALVAYAFITSARVIFTTALYFHVKGYSTGGFNTDYLEKSFIHTNN